MVRDARYDLRDDDRLLIRQDYPCYYDLEPFNQGAGIQFNINLHVIDFLVSTLARGTPVIEMFEESEKCLWSPFAKGDAWGFDKCFRPMPASRKGFASYAALYMPVGKDMENRHQSWRLSASVSALTEVLTICHTPPECGVKQLVEVHTGTIRNQSCYACPINVTLSPEMVRWLGKQPDKSHSREASEAMRKAEDTFWGPSEGFLAECDCYFRKPHWVNFNIPGNACGLDPKDYWDFKDGDRGYEMLPHNTDCPEQQLNLLVGVAALCVQARK